MHMKIVISNSKNLRLFQIQMRKKKFIYKSTNNFCNLNSLVQIKYPGEQATLI